MQATGKSEGGRESMKYEHLKTCTELDRKTFSKNLHRRRKFVANESELFYCFELFPETQHTVIFLCYINLLLSLLSTSQNESLFLGICNFPT
jgi:hypothetical protein